MSALLKLVFIAVIMYGVFDIFVHIYMKWTGKSKEQATRDIHNFLNSDSIYSVKNDAILNEKMWGIVKSVIGDERYSKLVATSEDLKLLNYDETSGVPCLQYSMDIEENEKKIIQERMKSKLGNTLKVHNFNEKILAIWSFNEWVDMPCLYLYYSETDAQLKLLCKMATQQHNESPRKGKILVDEDVL